MPPITIWNIYSSDGRYLGQASAFAPHTAFCLFMLVSGKQVAENDIVFETTSGDSGRVIYLSEEFVVSPQGTPAPVPLAVI
jgi:hypothetical protein